jgi:hypothetical protein
MNKEQMIELETLDLYWDFFSPTTKLVELVELIRSFGGELTYELHKNESNRILTTLSRVLTALNEDQADIIKKLT